jgi:hypothetical protein
MAGLPLSLRYRTPEVLVDMPMCEELREQGAPTSIENALPVRGRVWERGRVGNFFYTHMLPDALTGGKKCSWSESLRIHRSPQ